MTKVKPAVSRHISRSSMMIATLSTVVEWYDFTLYLYLATVLSRVFFGGTEHSLLTTLAGFAVSYCMRPIGAAVFGYVGDKFGRRRTLLLSMALITAAMLATALLPTYEQIGVTSGVLLLALRCVMAFAVGGEYTAVVAYLLEGAKPHRTGLITSLASAASEVGALLAVAVSAATVAMMSTASLDSHGWRIPFFIGVVLATIVLIARSTMQESPEFEKQIAKGSVPASPLRHVLRHHFGAIVKTFCISALGSITYYVGIAYVPTFLTSAGGQIESTSLSLSTFAAVAVIVVTPLFGALSDRIGRKRVLIGLAIFSALLPLPLFSYMAHGTHLQITLGAIVLALIAGGVSAVGAVATAEQFPNEGRLSGLALGATLATAVFGGMTPLFAEYLVNVTGWKAAPGAMIAVVALAVLPVLFSLYKDQPAPLSGSK